MSTKTVAEKLGIKKGQRILIVGAPEGYSLGALPDDAKLLAKPSAEVDLAQVFVTSMKELQQKLPKLKSGLKPEAPSWVTYPKGTSKMKADVDLDIIRKYASTIGLETVAIFAVDETWSALRLKRVKE